MKKKTSLHIMHVILFYFIYYLCKKR